MKEKTKWGGGGEGGESVCACGEIYLEAGFYSEGSSQTYGEPEFVLQEFDASRWSATALDRYHLNFTLSHATRIYESSGVFL